MQHFDLCSFIKHLRDWPCRNSKTPQRTQSGLKPSSLANPFPYWAIWLRWQPARLHSSSHFPMLTHFGDGGVSPFIDIDGGSQLQSIFAAALDAPGWKESIGAQRVLCLALGPILSSSLISSWCNEAESDLYSGCPPNRLIWENGAIGPIFPACVSLMIQTGVQGAAQQLS